MNILDLGHAAGTQARNDHRGARAQIAGQDRSAGQLGAALKHGDAPIDLNLRAHLAQLVDVLEAVIVYAFGYYRSALRDAQQHAHLWLHVGREARIRQGLYIRLSQGARALYKHGILVLLHDGSGLAELCTDALKMLRDDVLHEHFPACRRGGDHVGARLDLVGNDSVAAAMELLDAVHLDGIGARAADIRAHGIEEVCKVNYMRLARGVLDDGTPLSEGRRKDYIHRRADGDLVEIYSRAVELTVSRGGIHKAVADVNIRAQSGHALDMLVYRTDAEVAAAGHGGLRGAEAAEHCADKIVRSSYLAHEVIRRVAVMDVRAVYFYGGFIYKADFRAEVGQDRQKHIRVAYLGEVLYTAHAVNHQSRRDYRDRRILRSAYLNFAVQRAAALNNIFFQ